MTGSPPRRYLRPRLRPFSAGPIVWVNADSVTHTATADGGAFDTGFLAPGAISGAVTLPAGTFPYHCAIHPAMVATLIVQP